jgi:hypothetical protein
MIITTDTGTTETSINQIIQGGKYEFCIDSRDIAAEFGRTPNSVLQIIDSLIADQTISLDEFERHFYKKRGVEYQFFSLNRAGFLKAIPFIGGLISRQCQKCLVDEYLRIETVAHEQQSSSEKMGGGAMSWLLATPAANRGSKKAIIEQRLNHTEFRLIEQCNFELDECRIKAEQSEKNSNMSPADWDQWLGEVCYES